MNCHLKVHGAGPGMTIQDHGRPGYARFGLSAGGAMDTWALAEGAALLGNPHHAAAIEMAAIGGRFEIIDKASWIALSGGEMKATLNGRAVPWRSCFPVAAGDLLEIGNSRTGTYGYLHIAGGFELSREIGAVGNHIRAGIGGHEHRPLQAGDVLTTNAANAQPTVAMKLPTADYLERRCIRILWGPQSDRFKAATRQRLLTEKFVLSHRRDRMAMRIELQPDQPPFEALLTGLSDPVMDGDIQMTGDGVPAILVREHQPTGGYPRIASVISADLAAVAQLPTGNPFRFQLVCRSEAVAALKRQKNALQSLERQLAPVIRSADQIDNLLDFNLIDGMVSATED